MCTVEVFESCISGMAVSSSLADTFPSALHGRSAFAVFVGMFFLISLVSKAIMSC